ncbi:MAG: hypothetical protein LPJ91_00985 [Pseudazoarcus pumilus]|nr:hypothetical protein [Pseudazoarcus pumilus]
MELKDFVRESLVQISMGISEASEALKTTNAHINPKNIYVNADNRQNYGRLHHDKTYYPVVELVEFDVAVHASEGTETNGKIGISIGSIGLGAGGKSQESNKSESRIKFRVPVTFPSHDKT